MFKGRFKNLDESEQNKISVSFYETSSKLKELYYQFIRNEISTYFDDDLFFKKFRLSDFISQIRLVIIGMIDIIRT